MTLNKRSLKKLTDSWRITITKEQQRKILARFRDEPWPYEWSDQDITVQIRTFLAYGQFNKEPMGLYDIFGNPTRKLETPEGEPPF